MKETFEQIITDHNNEHMKIFTDNSPEGEMQFSDIVKISALVDALNKKTEARLTELFDKSFLKTAKIKDTK